MLFPRRKANGVEVHIGAQFRRQLSGSVSERAEVLDLTADAAGIPHVRFQVSFDHPEGTSRPADDVRTLSLQGFKTTFNQPLDS